MPEYTVAQLVEIGWAPSAEAARKRIARKQIPHRRLGGNLLLVDIADVSTPTDGRHRDPAEEREPRPTAQQAQVAALESQVAELTHQREFLERLVERLDHRLQSALEGRPRDS